MASNASPTPASRMARATKNMIQLKSDLLTVRSQRPIPEPMERQTAPIHRLKVTSGT